MEYYQGSPVCYQEWLATETTEAKKRRINFRFHFYMRRLRVAATSARALKYTVVSSVPKLSNKVSGSGSAGTQVRVVISKVKKACTYDISKKKKI